MAAHLQITLDTTAPQITWGAVAGTVAGDLLHVGYELDEPEVLEAELEIADGRILAMTVAGGELQVELPPDTADGWATVRVDVGDDVGNIATRERAVLLTGTVVVPPLPPDRRGGLAPLAPRRIVTPVRVAVRTATVVTSGRVRVRSTIVAGTATRRLEGPGRPPAHRVSAPLRGIARLTTVVPIRGPATLTGARIRSETRIRRRDDPDVEAILLDLI